MKPLPLRTIGRFWLYFFMGLIPLLSFLEPVQAAGELMVAPTRVVFEGRTRTAQVTLINTGAEATTYRISIVRKRMLANGGFENIDAPREGELFADELVRFSPRQVTLDPGQSQVIRILLQKPANLPEGEYRSHLLFRSLPKTEVAGIANGKTTEGINIQLEPLLAISIPVIVRQGATGATAGLTGAEIVQSGSGPVLGIRLERSGNRSLFGDLSVLYIAEDGAATTIGKANGIAVYTPLSVRSINLPLHLPARLSLNKGKLAIRYHSRPDEGGSLLAETELTLH